MQIWVHCTGAKCKYVSVGAAILGGAVAGSLDVPTTSGGHQAQHVHLRRSLARAQDTLRSHTASSSAQDPVHGQSDGYQDVNAQDLVCLGGFL